MKEIRKNPNEKNILYTLEGTCYHPLPTKDFKKTALSMLERTKYLFKPSEKFLIQLTSLEPTHTNKFCMGNLKLELAADNLYLSFKNEIDDHMCRKTGLYECPFYQIEDIKIESRENFNLMYIYFTDKWDYRVILKYNSNLNMAEKIQQYIKNKNYK